MKFRKEKNTREETKKNKKKVIIVGGISLLTILGGTLAYFTTSSNISNELKTAKYQTKIVEKFTSSSDWTPGTTTEKTIKVTNTGSIDMAVRVSYTERWINANGNDISLKDKNNNVAAIINFNDGWTKDSDGHYYYGSKANMTKLAPNETTTSFISGVTFNENIEVSLKKTVSSDGQTITYESTGEGYDNARYILVVTIDTIQHDQAINVW